MAIQFKSFETIEEALFVHKKITGYGFFESYENHKAGTIKRIEEVRDSPWMLDEVTGQIFYVAKVAFGLRILNRMSLGACLDDSLFQEVTILEDGVILIGKAVYKKDNVSRKTLAAMDITVTTGMVPTVCDGCVRQDKHCHHWDNFGKHDQHAPIRCERFTTDVAVLKAEAEALAKVKHDMAEADRTDPPPL